MQFEPVQYVARYKGIFITPMQCISLFNIMFINAQCAPYLHYIVNTKYHREKSILIANSFNFESNKAQYTTIVCGVPCVSRCLRDR